MSNKPALNKNVPRESHLPFKLTSERNLTGFDGERNGGRFAADGRAGVLLIDL